MEVHAQQKINKDNKELNQPQRITIIPPVGTKNETCHL